MDLKINSVLTLEGGKKYTVLKAINYSGKKYYFAMQKKDMDLIATDVIFLQVIVENNERFIEIINDEELLQQLVKLI